MDASTNFRREIHVRRKKGYKRCIPRQRQTGVLPHYPRQSDNSISLWNTRFDRLLVKMSRSSGKCCIKAFRQLATTSLHERSCNDRSSPIMPTAGGAWATLGLSRTTRKTDQSSAPFGCASGSINPMDRRNLLLQSNRNTADTV